MEGPPSLPLADFGVSYREYLGEFSGDIAFLTLLLGHSRECVSGGWWRERED